VLITIWPWYRPPSGLLSGLSSPLTSLSSLDGIEPLNLPSGSQPTSSGDTASGSELLDPDPEILDAVKVNRVNATASPY
jgi:hypothetical protein